MTYGQIEKAIKNGLNVGGNLSAVYLKRFKETFLGEKRSIESFVARYNDEGDGVVFEYTINGKAKIATIKLQKSIDWSKK